MDVSNKLAPVVATSWRDDRGNLHDDWKEALQANLRYHIGAIVDWRCPIMGDSEYAGMERRVRQELVSVLAEAADDVWDVLVEWKEAIEA